MRRLCEENGRSPDSVAVTLRATLGMGEPQRSQSGQRAPLTGTAAEIVEDIRRYEEAGLEYLVLAVSAKDTDSTTEAVRRYADVVVSRYR